MRTRLDFARAAGGVLAAGAVAVLVAVGAAGTDPKPAAARAVSATGAAALSHSIGSDAIVRAAAMAPGDTATGTVRIGNEGEATGAFTLAESDVLDTPGAGGGRLSTRLDLRIEDVATGRSVYRGVLGAMDERPLGHLRPGERRTYRFRLAMPDSAKDGTYAGSRVEVRFDWTAVTAEPPRPAAAPDDADPPRLVVQAPLSQRLRGRAVTIALTCEERCSVVGFSRGARPEGRRGLKAGRPALLTITLSPTDVKMLEARLARRGTATLTVAMTVGDRAGNRASQDVAVRLRR